MKRAIILATIILAACDNGGDDTGAAGGSGATGSTGAKTSSSMSGTQTTGATMSAQQPFTAGSRLKVRTLTSDDGAKEQRGFFDTELDVACAFAIATDGTERCMPIDVPVADRFFKDPDCFYPVATSTCPSIPNYARVVVDACPAATTIRQVTGPYLLAGVYVKTLGACTQIALGSSSAFELGPEVPASTWVRATESVE